MKWVFTEQQSCEYSLLWLPRKTSQEALGWVGQTLVLEWVAQLLASRCPPFTDLQPRKAVIIRFPIICSGLHAEYEHLSKEKNRELMKISLTRPWEEKNHKPLLLLEDGKAKTYHLQVPESSEVCSHSGMSFTFFGVPPRTTQLLCRDDLCQNRQCYHPQKGLITIQGSEELLRNPNTKPFSKVKSCTIM